MFSLPFCFTVCWWFILSKAVLCWCILYFLKIALVWYALLDICLSFALVFFFLHSECHLNFYICLLYMIWMRYLEWTFLHDVAIIHYNTNGAEQAQVLHEINPFWMRLASNCGNQSAVIMFNFVEIRAWRSVFVEVCAWKKFERLPLE